MSDLGGTDDRRFSRAETADLIRRATELQHRVQDTLSYDQLVDVAREVGIDQATVDATIRQVQRETANVTAQRDRSVLDRCLQLLCLKAPAKPSWPREDA